MVDTPTETEIDPEDDEDVLDPEGEPEGETSEDEDGDSRPEEDGSDDLDDAARERQRREERQPSRAERRIQAAVNDRNRLAEENARITRELNEIRRQIPQQYEDPRAEQERLALMSPEDRIQYTVDKALRRQEQQTQALVANMQQQADKTAFDARCATDTLRKKLAPEVEREYAAVISRGQYLPRETIYIHLLGLRAEAARSKAKPQAEQNRRRNAAPPSRGRGDETVDRRGRRSANSVEEFERRNADVLL